MSYAMFRVALLLVGVAICQVTAEPKPESEVPDTRLYGIPWVHPPTVSSAVVSTVTTTVQVPLYIVRTTTVSQQGGVHTVFLPGQAPQTVYLTSIVYSTVTQWSGGGVSTIYLTSYFPVTITVAAAQQIVRVETVTQFVAPSVFNVTRTVIRECSDTFTRTRTRTRTQEYVHAYLTLGVSGTPTQIQTQTIPSQYLRY